MDRYVDTSKKVISTNGVMIQDPDVQVFLIFHLKVEDLVPSGVQASFYSGAFFFVFADYLPTTLGLQRGHSRLTPRLRLPNLCILLRSPSEADDHLMELALTEKAK